MLRDDAEDLSCSLWSDFLLETALKSGFCAKNWENHFFTDTRTLLKHHENSATNHC